MLEAEVDRLSMTLDESRSSLEEMQMRTVADATAASAEMAALRLAFRKRCRDGHDHAAQLAVSIDILESEVASATAVCSM